MVTTVDDRALNEVGRVLDRKVEGGRPEYGVYLNFLDAFLGLDKFEYMASDFPRDFFEGIVDLINEQPAMLLAIRAWDEEADLTEATPPADGILGTAATEALRMAKALSAARFGTDAS